MWLVAIPDSWYGKMHNQSKILHSRDSDFWLLGNLRYGTHCNLLGCFYIPHFYGMLYK
jgi:hypothetical protein